MEVVGQVELCKPVELCAPCAREDDAEDEDAEERGFAEG
jgi:hypothetical protein